MSIAITNINEFVLTIHARVSDNIEKIAYLIFLSFTCLIIKYKPSIENANPGISPYANTQSKNIGKNVNINIVP